MDERRLRIGSLFEWPPAALGVAGSSGSSRFRFSDLSGPRVDAALVDVREKLPPGVPGGTTSVPVMLLLDGREIKLGDLETKVRSLLPQSRLRGPPIVTSAISANADLRLRRRGSRFYVVCERAEPGGPMRVAGVYVH